MHLRYSSNDLNMTFPQSLQMDTEKVNSILLPNYVIGLYCAIEKNTRHFCFGYLSMYNDFIIIKLSTVLASFPFFWFLHTKYLINLFSY